MIKLDISTLIFFYTLFSAIVILAIWIVSVYRKPKRSGPGYEDSVWKCSVCFQTYVDSKHEDISECPACGSYNKKSEVA